MATKTRKEKALAVRVERAGAAAEHTLQALRVQAEALVELVARRKASITEAFYDIGEALGKLSAKRLYTALGFERFGDLVEQRLGMSAAQGRKLIGITQQLSRPRALRLGQERAAALLRLASATRASDTAEQLAEQGISLPGKSGRVAPETLSVRAILGAARAHKRSPAGVPAAARAARKRLDASAALLRKRLLEAGATSASSEVSVRKQGNGRLVVLELAVPLEDALTLAKVLGAH